MALSLKLSKNNNQLVKGIHLPTGETFYIRAEKIGSGVQLLLDGDRDLFDFKRINKDDIVLDEFNRAVEVDKEFLSEPATKVHHLPHDYQINNWDKR